MRFEPGKRAVIGAGLRRHAAAPACAAVIAAGSCGSRAVGAARACRTFALQRAVDLWTIDLSRSSSCISAAHLVPSTAVVVPIHVAVAARVHIVTDSDRAPPCSPLTPPTVVVLPTGTADHCLSASDLAPTGSADGSGTSDRGGAGPRVDCGAARASGVVA